MRSYVCLAALITALAGQAWAQDPAPKAVRDKAEAAKLRDAAVLSRLAAQIQGRRVPLYLIEYRDGRGPKYPEAARRLFASLKDPEAQAEVAVALMTPAEKLALVVSFTDPDHLAKIPDVVIPDDQKKALIAAMIPGVSGYVPGVPRLAIPSQTETDASLGVRNPNLARTALPSSLATAASWDPKVTEAGGAMIGHEARQSGFDVMLAGGADLAREPRNGRNFEYVGEDPWLAGQMAGGLVQGIQSNHIISTMKHFAVNDQESQRTTVDATISKTALRESDLLAFEFLNDRAHPGSVMCSYNLVNGAWACENPYLLTTVLKGDWGFKGYVMSDWGAVHSTVAAANAGLDQESGYPTDDALYFGKPLAAAGAAGTVPTARLDDMARRILWALFAKGVYDHPVAPGGAIDFDADAKVAQAAAEQSLVLLKNDGGLLPLKTARSIVLIGGHADKGVLAGGGSSSVTPIGGNAVPGLAPTHWPGPITYLPSSPLKALQALKPQTAITYDSGEDIAAAAKAAAASDIAVVFVTQWTGESFDVPLDLQGSQNALVEAVVAANPHTIVVVESGGAVLMPWHDKVPAILEAFYPGERGGEAIANILTGQVNPSGHLPISLPASADQLIHPTIPGFGQPDGTRVGVTYDEGAAIGYKAFDLKGQKPLFAFGHGLSYSRFSLSGLTAHRVGRGVRVRFTVKNIGGPAGAAVAQVYVSPKSFRAAGWEAPKRLGGFAKVALTPGQSLVVSLTIDPRLLATYDEASDRWVIARGTYQVSLGQASDDLPVTARLSLPGAQFSAAHAAARR